MALSRSQLLLLSSLILLWAVVSCSYANGASIAAPASSNDSIPATARVHVDSRVEDLYANTWRTIYNVPSDRYFVLTDLDTIIEGTAEIALAERRNNFIVTKRETYFMRREEGFHSSCGIVFRPGSEVILFNRLPFQTLPADIGYSLTGYFLDQ